jgi:hypothetical protein
MAEQDLREQVARILLPAAFERLDDGCADREDREEIAGALEIASDVLSLVSSTKEGWRLVPVEPTEEMIEAYCTTLERLGFTSWVTASTVWAAMLAASPSPKLDHKTPSEGER